jgi:hypothetical protein
VRGGSSALVPAGSRAGGAASAAGRRRAAEHAQRAPAEAERRAPLPVRAGEHAPVDGVREEPSSVRIAGTSAQLNPVRSERRSSPRSGRPRLPTSSACTSPAARRLRAAMSSVQPGLVAGYSVCVPRSADRVEPSACTRTNRAACARFAIRARATLPMLVPAVRVRVITTRRPARSSSARSFSETASTTCGSPAVPPPSLIFRSAEPGPIGSVPGFARRSCPGSTTTTGRAADRADAAVPTASARPSIASAATRRAGITAVCRCQSSSR